MNMKTILHRLCILLAPVVICVELSFTPSPNITILQSAVYQCALSEVADGDAVSVSWKVNGISSSSDSWESNISSHGIAADGIGHNSTLTIPGDPTLNGTRVRCIGSGLLVNEEPYNMYKNKILYIQGKPQHVHLMSYTVSLTQKLLTWSVPDTIAGVNITYYRVNITNETHIITTKINETEYTYDVCQLGYNNVSVAAVIGELAPLEGIIESIKVEKVVVSGWSSSLFYDADTDISVNVTVDNPNLCNYLKPEKMNMHVTLSELDKVEYVSTSVVNIDEKLKAEFENVGRGNIKANLMMEYKHGLQILLNETQFINAFVVQNVTITTTDHVCFHITYIPSIAGSLPSCLIEYNSSDANITGNLFIINSIDKCLETNIPRNNYSVYAYDINPSNTTYIAFSILNTEIGTESMYPSHSSHTVSTSNIHPSIYSSVYPSPTMRPSSSTPIIIGLSVGLPVVACAILIIIGGIVFYLIVRRYLLSNLTNTCTSKNTQSALRKLFCLP